MPNLELSISRAWWHADRHGSDRIQYVVVREDGRERRLFADRATQPALWHELKDALEAVGYKGPRAFKSVGRPIEDVELL